MNIEELKQKAIQTIDQRREVYLALGRKIYENPETGYREVKTLSLIHI